MSCQPQPIIAVYFFRLNTQYQNFQCLAVSCSTSGDIGAREKKRLRMHSILLGHHDGFA